MTKKRNVKAAVDEESDRNYRESSSDGSVLENPITNGTINSKSRRCKVQGSNKTTNILNIRRSKSKRLSESSCDSVAKEVSDSNKEIELDNKIASMPEESSCDTIGNNHQDAIPDDKGDEIKLNSDKYSELLNILSSKEGDIDNFLKQYTIWQQSQLSIGKHVKTKKNVTKPQRTQQKPMKTKANTGTPVVRLIKNTNSKKTNKDSNKKSSVSDHDMAKELDFSLSEHKAKNSEMSSSLNLEDNNTKTGDSDEIINHLSDTKTENKHSKEMAEDIVDCSKDVLTDTKSYTISSKVKCKSLEEDSSGMQGVKREPVQLSKEEKTDCFNRIDTRVKVDIDFKESSKHQINAESSLSGLKEVKLSDKEISHLTPEAKNNIENNKEMPALESEGNLNNEELGKKDLVHENEDEKSETCVNDVLELPDSDDLLPGKIQENTDRNNIISDLSDVKKNNVLNDTNGLASNNTYIKQSISEVELNSLSDNSETNKPFNDQHSHSVVDDSKSQSFSSNMAFQNSDSENKQKTEDKADTSAGHGVNNAILIERDSETDTVWKRKRRMSDEKTECPKRIKPVTKSNEIKFDLLQHDITSSEYNKWNSEESSSFFEELIYSDEEKHNNFIDDDVSYHISKSADEPTNLKENLSCKIRKYTSKSDLEKKVIEKSHCIKNNFSPIHDNFDDSPKKSIELSNTENMDIPNRKINKELKAKDSSNAISSTPRRTKLNLKEKISKVSSKSKKKMKSKVRPKSKKSSLYFSDDVKNQIKNKFDDSYESMLKKVKKQLKSGHKSILETDLPVVEVSYKGEFLHGILGSVCCVDFLTKYKLNNENKTNENILNSSHAQDILIQSLRPLCSEALREGYCKDLQNCRKEHKVPNDFFSIMDKHDAWLIVAFVLRISNCLSENILTAILEFLSKYKARTKILLVSRHIFLSQQNNYPIQKSCWDDILIALECCGLQRWEGMRSVIQFITDTYSSPKAIVFHQVLKIWNVHGSSLSNTWQIVEPLVTRNIIVLQPLILSKLIAELITVEPKDKDKVNIYRLLVQQLTSLTKENFNQISYRLLNDFLRKLSHEGLHSEEKVLREIMNTSYYTPFFPQQSPTLSSSSSLRRCRSLTNLNSVSSDSKLHIKTTVHEEEKMGAAIERALLCSNYDSVIKVIIASYKKVFISKVLLVVLKFAVDKNSYIILKNIFVKLKTSFAQYVDDLKDLIGSIVVTIMLDYVKQYNWKEANNYFNLLEENHVNKYKLKSLTDATLRPVRLAVVYSEIHYYNGRYKESIGVFINIRLIDPDSVKWAIPGGSKEDFHIIGVMVVFLLNELIIKKIVNIATMLFKAVLEAQNGLTEPIDIGHFFEVLLYKLFEMTDEYPETAVKLYMRVMAKDNNMTLYGLTYRALIILAYRTHKRAIIKDIFYKAINEYVYPMLEANENLIMLLRSHTEEEIIVYILEWVARFKEKQPDSCNHQIQIKFKDAVLEDYLDNKALGIPALLKEVDQTLPGAIKRLESVLKRLHIKFKQIKKDTFSIDPLSFQNFLTKIKVY